jgi:RNA polymerase sigma-70 factor (ECF subfamily)
MEAAVSGTDAEQRAQSGPTYHERLGPTAIELCEQYAHRVYRYAAMVSRGDVEAEDLAQDALERAIRRLDSFDPSRGPVDVWLWRIVLSAAADAGRLAKRRYLLVDRLRALGERDHLSEPPPAFPVSERELLSAIRELGARDRSIIALRFGAGLPYAEIGAALGMTPAAAGVAGRRALTRLRRRLERGRNDE